jgi:hypothetical protein
MAARQHGFRNAWKIVLEPQNQKIAGLYLQGWRLVALFIDIAVADFTRRLKRTAEGQADAKNAVLTSNFMRSCYLASYGRARANFRFRAERKCKG